MPKKFRGENSKAVEARVRKAAAKEAETERQQRQVEEEYWKEDDKNVLKRLQRKASVFYLAYWSYYCRNCTDRMQLYLVL